MDGNINFLNSLLCNHEIGEIDGLICFILDYKNESWSYEHTTYFVMDNGNVYKVYDHKNLPNLYEKQGVLKLKLQTSKGELVQNISGNEFSMILKKRSLAKIDVDKNETRTGFDGGETEILVYNPNVDCELPINIGARGDVCVKSSNVEENNIIRWLLTNIRTETPFFGL
jgi:hypothetical protein